MIKKIRALLAHGRLGEALRFVITGGVCFLLDYAVMLLCKEALGLNYLVAAGLGFLASVVLNYILCVRWVFEGANESGRRKVVFFITSAAGLGLTELLMFAFVDWMGIDYRIAKLVTVALVMVFNYFTKRAALKAKA